MVVVGISYPILLFACDDDVCNYCVYLSFIAAQVSLLSTCVLQAIVTKRDLSSCKVKMSERFYVKKIIYLTIGGVDKRCQPSPKKIYYNCFLVHQILPWGI